MKKYSANDSTSTNNTKLLGNDTENATAKIYLT